MASIEQRNLYSVEPRKHSRSGVTYMVGMAVIATSPDEAMLFHPFSDGEHKYDPTDGKWKNKKGNELHHSALATWPLIPSHETLKVKLISYEKSRVIGVTKQCY